MHPFSKPTSKTEDDIIKCPACDGGMFRGEACSFCNPPLPSVPQYPVDLIQLEKNLARMLNNEIRLAYLPPVPRKESPAKPFLAQPFVAPERPPQFCKYCKKPIFHPRTVCNECRSSRARERMKGTYPGNHEAL